MLITGLSGSGKSTLAAYCLAKGMKFIGDDRIAISKENGHAVARPIYKTLSLENNIDGIDIVDSVLQPHSIKKNLILDKQHVHNSMIIKSVIEPHKINGNEPKIIRANSTPLLTRVCMDFSRFSRLTHNINLIEDYHNIYNLLGNIDYHIIELSKSANKNAEFIVNFITKGSAYVQD